MSSTYYKLFGVSIFQSLPYGLKRREEEVCIIPKEKNMVIEGTDYGQFLVRFNDTKVYYICDLVQKYNSFKDAMNSLKNPF